MKCLFLGVYIPTEDVGEPKIIIQKQQNDISNNKNIVIIDGLMYQNQPFTKQYSWQEAKEYASHLRLGGFNDWRLPTREELKKLITEEENRGKNGGFYIRKEFVDNLESFSWFWTSTEYDSSSAWVVRFRNGYDGWGLHSDTDYALCVR